MHQLICPSKGKKSEHLLAVLYVSRVSSVYHSVLCYMNNHFVVPFFYLFVILFFSFLTLLICVILVCIWLCMCKCASADKRNTGLMINSRICYILQPSIDFLSLKRGGDGTEHWFLILAVLGNNWRFSPTTQISFSVCWTNKIFCINNLHICYW